MRHPAVAAALVLAVYLTAPHPLAAQDSSTAVLQRARSYYEGLDLERALPLLRQVVSSQWPYEITPAQRVDAYKYLAAALVLVGQSDSAVSYFAAALARDPFTDLDPQEFTPAQRSAFASARPLVFAVAARPLAEARVDVRSERIRFVVATTHRAALQVLLRPLEEGATAFPVFQGENDGEREIAWDGLTPDGRLVETGRYALLVVGTSRVLDRTDSARVYFLVAREAVTLEDTLPALRRGLLLPERVGAPGATRELAKGLIIAGGALLASSAVVNRELGGGGRGGARVVASLGVLAGAAGFLTLSRRHDIPANIQANVQRQAERRATNQAIEQRNADRLARAVLIISPAAGVGP